MVIERTDLPQHAQPAMHAKKTCELKGDVFERLDQFHATFQNIARQAKFGGNVAINPIETMTVVARMMAEMGIEIQKLQVRLDALTECVTRSDPDPGDNGKSEPEVEVEDQPGPKAVQNAG